jgi:hypothetical protein
MLLFGALTAVLLISLSIVAAYIRRDEVMANWSKYRDNPLYMFAAPMFKPDEDPRSRLGFAADNFRDVIVSLMMKVFAVFLQPVMKIIQMVTSSMEESLKGIMNMRGLFKNMFQKFSSVTNVFQRRYNNTFHALRVTWTKLRESLNKTFGVAVSSLYAGVSAFRAIDNAARLMTIVAIVILSILLGFVIFFFFILWPILPIIIIGIHFVAQTPYAGEVMGMESAFCFEAETYLPTTDGKKMIKDVKVGDVLVYNDERITVKGTMILDGEYEPLYDLYGVQVSGAHIYYENGVATFVSEARDALPGASRPDSVYCLITSSHTIPVLSNNGVLLFADWEEIQAEEDLATWNKTVFEMLNPDTAYEAPSKESLASEAAFSEQSSVFTPLGPVQIRNLHPGTTVFDAKGLPTRVTGVVQLDISEITAAEKYDETTFVSAGTWIRSGTKWAQPKAVTPPPANMKWYMLFTEAGSFRVVTSNFQDIVVRDFSDVGSHEIQKTYDWVLESLRATAA